MSLFVLVGLGNPGTKYIQNRHNIGFMAIDSIALAYGFPPFRIKFSAAITEGLIKDHKVILCKPLTFMNLSGQPVSDLSRFYKISPEAVYVIHDDLDLEPGKVKCKKGGGSGGHNGLGSLDQCIGKEYWRVRLGIGHPGRPALPVPGNRDRVSSYVLGNFSHEERLLVQEMINAVTQEVDMLFGIDPGVWLAKIANLLKNPTLV